MANLGIVNGYKIIYDGKQSDGGCYFVVANKVRIAKFSDSKSAIKCANELEYCDLSHQEEWNRLLNPAREALCYSNGNVNCTSRVFDQVANILGEFAANSIDFEEAIDLLKSIRQ